MGVEILEQRLARLKGDHLHRQLILPQGIDLTSSDYLGFAQDPELRERFLQRLQTEGEMQGATGSRLLRGHHPLYAQTEQCLADFVGREAALLFSSGYAANVGLLSSLLQVGDHVFSDEFNHASIIDGIRLGRAEKHIFPHRDYRVLEHQLASVGDSCGLKLIISESLFSMDGTLANLAELVRLSAAHQALLIIDEAHSTGLWGGSLVHSLGLTSRVFATIHTAGKALGAGGAWIAGDRILQDYLVQHARTFIFSTAPIPALAFLLQEAVAYYKTVGMMRAVEVRKRAQAFREWLGSLGSSVVGGEAESPIVPIVIGSNWMALKVSQALQSQGWDIRAIRPPTVPEGLARLRVTVKWQDNPQDLQRFVQDFGEMMGNRHSGINPNTMRHPECNEGSP